MNPKILDSIQKYDSIIIFRHILPDMDALGSQYGLASWIRSAYPQKRSIVPEKDLLYKKNWDYH